MVLVGNVNTIDPVAATIGAHRERFGISCDVVSGPQVEESAPAVAQLAGQEGRHEGRRHATGLPVTSVDIP